MTNIILRNFVRVIISVLGFLMKSLISRPKGMAEPRRIGILLWGGIGNYVLFSPALYAIRKKFPNTDLAIGSFLGTAEQMFSKTPDVFLTVSDKPSLNGVLKLLFLLKEYKPDTVISNTMSPTFLTALIAFLSGAKVRMGMDRKNRGFLNNVRIEQRSENEVLTNCRIAELLTTKFDSTLQMDISSEDKKIAKQTLENLVGHKIGSPLIAIQPGSGRKQSFKRWDIENFKELTGKLLSKGLRSVIVGTEEEREEIDYIARHIKNKNLKILRERLTLPQLTHFLGNFDLIIANDTSLVHLGAVVGTPSVVIYGPTDPAKNEPWGIESRIVKRELACSPCYDFSVPKCRYDFQCLQEITVEEVYDAVMDLLSF